MSLQTSDVRPRIVLGSWRMLPQQAELYIPESDADPPHLLLLVGAPQAAPPLAGGGFALGSIQARNHDVRIWGNVAHPKPAVVLSRRLAVTAKRRKAVPCANGARIAAS